MDCAEQPIAAWQLVELVAEGNCCDLYRARPADTGSSSPADYCIKILRKGSDRRVGQMMLRRQFAACSAINHPNVIPVLAAELDAELPYIVMPWIEGKGLDVWIATKSNQPLPVMLWLIRQLAQAIEAIHSAGWIHADIKPQNVVLTAGGHLMLIDLGLAQSIDRVEPKLGLGTRPYTAPERWLNQPELSAASDIYSLGVVAFELLSGSLPSACGTFEQYLPDHLQRSAMQLRGRLPLAPPALEKVLYRLLAKQPVRRPTASELIPVLTALEIATFGQHISPSTKRSA